MKIFVIFLLQFQFVIPCFADEVPKNVISYAKYSADERELLLTEAPSEIRALSLSIKDARRIRDKDKRRQEIESLTKKIEIVESVAKRLEDPFQTYYGVIDIRDITVGNIGLLDWSHATVMQVIDENNLLVSVDWSNGEMIAISNLLGGTKREVEKFSLTFWVTGIPTQDLIDGSQFNSDEVFLVGTKTYSTPNGSTNTVPLLEPFDVKPFSHLFTNLSDLRAWKSASGKHSLEAYFVKYEKGLVYLITPKKKTISLKLLELSDADQEYVRKLIKEKP